MRRALKIISLSEFVILSCFLCSVVAQAVRARYRTLATLDPDYLPASVQIGPGNKIAYVTEGDIGFSVVTGRTVGGPFQNAGGLTFEPNGSRVAFWVQRASRYYAVLGGRLFGPTQEIPDLGFSSDGEHFIYVDVVKQYVFVVDRSLHVQQFKFLAYKSSAGGRNAAFVVTIGSKQAVLVDGVVGPLFDEIYGATESPGTDPVSSRDLVFDETGDHFAYAAKREGRACVIKDNQIIGKCYERIFQGSLQIAPDGGRVTYLAGAGTKQFVVFGEKQESLFDEVGSVFLSPDWSVRVYSGRTGKSWTAVVNNVAHGSYENSMLEAAFSPDNRRVAFTTTRKGKEICITDGKAGPAYDDIYMLRFSPDGAHLVYLAVANAIESIVVDGKIIFDKHDAFSNILFSPDGRRLAIVARDGAAESVVVDQISTDRRYSRVITGSLRFSDDSQTIAYAAEATANKQYAIVGDHIYGPYPEILKLGSVGYISFLPGTSHAIYSVQNGDGFLVMTDGHPLFKLRCLKSLSISDMSLTGCLANAVTKITLSAGER